MSHTRLTSLEFPVNDLGVGDIKLGEITGAVLDGEGWIIGMTDGDLGFRAEESEAETDKTISPKTTSAALDGRLWLSGFSTARPESLCRLVYLSRARRARPARIIGLGYLGLVRGSAPSVPLASKLGESGCASFDRRSVSSARSDRPI